ncbi:DUF885 domain-containing protein [Stakelama saccharophila]|uniref:DUF885 domain-containing protein n=1 Tax=Stakelama saccharophila TaxID=3075605 RepID=A0ABZ0B831_9SPHN|nr:DUF885 domain-containing protein [Stakelama sp. W311]WNO52494.1 DUF885 domain-containing protein [Stakelama sp. W311]
MFTDRRSLLKAMGAGTALSSLPLKALAAENSDVAAETMLSHIAEAMMMDFPEQATSLGIDTDGRAPLKARLTDRSALGQRLVADHLRAHLANLDTLDEAALSDAVRTDVEVVRTAFDLALRGFAFPYGDVSVGSYRNSPYVVIQNVGAFLDVPQMLDSQHTVKNAADADAYLARLEDYAAALDGETQRLKADGAQGVIAPDFLLDKALKQLAIARSGDVEDWTIVTSLADRTKDIAGDYGKHAATIARDMVAPALDRQIAVLKQHRTHATHDAGAWKLPQGEDYYRWALQAGTTTTLSPDEIHQMGLDQLHDLQSQMDVILKQEGYSRGTVGERMAALGKDPKYLFPDNDEGRAQIIALLQKSIDDMRARMPQAFHTLVPGNAEVKRMAPEVEPGAPGAYGGAGSIDGTVPGRLWINLRTTKIWPRYALPDLAYHETIPGHVWQGEYTFKLPLVRSLIAFNAYSEGWALYAEQLADELGAYADNPLGRLGYLQSLAFRACRLVVDTGLHAKRWSREHAIQWFATTNGSTVEEVQGEVDRYCSWPGQACGYKVGHTTINRLRDKTKRALGAKYDFKGFNDTVVTGGGVPMNVLEQNVDRHIARQKA